ncbi:tripsin, putative [Pediculus humanus corporis]|uniref:Tripsin, putative n=1 Tax=Pediculus humanus subsp. corporis TaxID=121224 RepID=E0VQD6_PEDHC|nr:tripsin, putative [Pediculus humanus corporis]EEB15592.1 tripsin, putative [Pediculus humanus corporis]
MAEPGQFPFVVRLYSKLKESAVTYCTATIVTSDKLLTAGHCCNTKAVRFVVSGDPDQTDFVASNDKNKYVVYFVKKIILHPNFERTETKLVHDLCLMILEKPLTLKDGRHKTIEISYEKLKRKTNCTALGWGKH